MQIAKLQKEMSAVISSFFIFFGFWACSGQESEDQQSSSQQPSLGYAFDEPSQVYTLPEELEEVSGMAVFTPELLLLNEDETGTLYFFKLEENKVESKVVFGEDDDYEGTAIHGNKGYVVTSEGTIFEIGNIRTEDPVVREHKNKALKNCDVEGLHYLKGEHKLLIACKEGVDNGNRKVHSFSLETNELDPEPYRVLNLAEVEDKFLSTNLDKVSVELKKALDPKGESGILYPSGIAIHPQTNDLYVLSSKSKLLVVYNAEGTLKEVVELRNELFRQPEAIAFAPNGDLLIGNEGSGEKANILRFVYAKE